MVAAVLVAVAVLGGCGNGSDTSRPTGHVRGTALAGPTCPVEQNPPDPACADRAVVGAAQFRQDGRVVTTAVINPAGEFTADLKVGSYEIVIDGGANMFPVCQPATVVVAQGATASVKISCDTGIR